MACESQISTAALPSDFVERFYHGCRMVIVLEEYNPGSSG